VVTNTTLEDIMVALYVVLEKENACGDGDKMNPESSDECMSCPILSGLRDESLCLKCYSKSLVWYLMKRREV